jgi:diguanylate cyclase (GGDEF)-like protein
MNIVPFNIENFSSIQKIMEELASIKVSVYGGDGRMLAPSSDKDAIESIIVSSQRGKNEYDRFIRQSIRYALKANEVKIEQAFSGQFYFFIPCVLDDSSLVLVGGAFYRSIHDFHEFILTNARTYNISSARIDELSKGILIADYEKILRISKYVQQLFSVFVKDMYDKKQYGKKYSRTKTILSLLANIEENISLNYMYTSIADMLIYLFNVDSLLFARQIDRGVISIFSAGRLKEYLGTFFLASTSSMLSEAVSTGGPFYCDDIGELRNLSLNDRVTSVHIFPITMKGTNNKYLFLFNTKLEAEEVEDISEICKYLHFVENSLYLKRDYENREKVMNSLNFALSELKLTLDKPDTLYSSIVETATRLSSAEKGSLLLAETDTELSMKAAYGMNTLDIKDLKVKIGEGIAGKVFEENVPVICNDIEKDFSVKRKSKYKTSSFISIPLKVGEETIGVLNISDKITGEIFQEEDLLLLHSFADFVSIALKGSSYYSLAEEMKELSITDPLTGLYNRRYFQDRLLEEIERSERYELNCSLCIIDIDDFKLFNDTEGHLSGDRILQKVSQLIHESLRTVDVFSRIGGEEFAVIMPQTDKLEAYSVAERVRNSIKDGMEQTWNTYPKKNITVSSGISSSPHDGITPQKLILNADRALYRAKMMGKNRTVAWEEKQE